MYACRTLRSHSRHIARASGRFRAPFSLSKCLSPSNQKDTWESIQACSTIGTVMEILVVDSEPFDVQVFRRGGNGLWPDEPERVAAGGIVRLTSIELEMLVDEIYASVQL